MTNDQSARGHEALVFIETSGNQSYLFGTNKLRENIGASQLTHLVGAEWAPQAAEEVGGTPIVATSGKAIIRVPGRAQGVELVRALSLRALRDAPGLSVAGAVVELRPGAERDALDAAHRRFDSNRDALGALRSPCLPWAEPCATSGLPAGGSGTEGDQPLWFSAECLAKRDRDRASEWGKRVNDILSGHAPAAGPRLWVKDNIEELQKDFEHSQWLGVVFSDGNGLGQVFMDLDHHLAALSADERASGDWTHLATIGRLSTELEGATRRAFCAACLRLHELGATRREHGRTYVPLIPLILAGDDLTVLVQGEFALPFAQRFLTAFEEETGGHGCPTIRRIAEIALGAPRLSAGAGVALVKHHFPFHLAHALAESLLKSAKLVKRRVQQRTRAVPYPVSALDFHVLYDASFTDLDGIRAERLTVTGPVGESCRLYAGPYVVTPPDRLAGVDPDGCAWALEHHFDALVERFKALNAEDTETGRPLLPSSQMHALREAAAQGKPAADARLRELRWLRDRGLNRLTDGADSLFFSRTEDQTTFSVTRFVDALNGAGFWPPSPTAADPAAEDSDHA